MLEQLAAAIVGGLIKGAASVGTKVVDEAYQAARASLKKYLPVFDPDSVTPENENSAKQVLEELLRIGNGDEHHALAKAFSALADALQDPDLCADLDALIDIKNMTAGEDINVSVDQQGKDVKAALNQFDAGGSITVDIRQTSKLNAS